MLKKLVSSVISDKKALDYLKKWIQPYEISDKKLMELQLWSLEKGIESKSVKAFRGLSFDGNY